jgi:hypothetical protein
LKIILLDRVNLDKILEVTPSSQLEEVYQLMQKVRDPEHLFYFCPDDVYQLDHPAVQPNPGFSLLTGRFLAAVFDWKDFSVTDWIEITRKPGL